MKPFAALDAVALLLAMMTLTGPALGSEGSPSDTVGDLSLLAELAGAPPVSSAAPALPETLEDMLADTEPMAGTCNHFCPGDPILGIDPYRPANCPNCSPCYENGEICGFRCFFDDGSDAGLHCFPGGCSNGC